jgi:ribonuclease Z
MSDARPTDPAMPSGEEERPSAGGLTRRSFIRGGAVLAGVAAAGAFGAGGIFGAAPAKADTPGAMAGLPPFVPGTKLEPGQMRISFMGTSFLPRIAQQCNSVFVELGNGDNFVFDFGSGVSSKYVAMGIQYSKLTRVFLTHLHGDHMSDLITLYCFGPASDRKTPLHIYGPSGDSEDEGTNEFCKNLYQLCKWHREGFSFLSTGLKGHGDGYDIVPHQLPYMKYGVAYRANGVTIRHFPAIHDRDGSISYKLTWNGMSMVFSGDTKPNTYMLKHAKGVDVLIHEMVVPATVWATKNSGGLQPGDRGYKDAVKVAKEVQESSHTPEKGLGYILNKTQPRLGIGTHFQANDDTVGPAYEAVRTWYDGGFAIAVDGFVVTLNKAEMSAAYADLDQFAWYPKPKMYPSKLLQPPKYDGPLAQFNRVLKSHIIPEKDYTIPPT